MKQQILHVLEYFDSFSYPPSFEEIHRFLPIRAERSLFLQYISRLHTEKKIIVIDDRVSLHRNLILRQQAHKKISEMHIQLLAQWRDLFKRIPGLQFMGISGSLSMLDSGKDDDIDLFVICSPRSLWTTRFFILTFKKILCMAGRPLGKKLCLNLLFSVDSLLLSPEKQSEYTAHEVLQLRPFIDKNNTYQQFLYRNRWVRSFCPNTRIKKSVIQRDENEVEGGGNNSVVEKLAERVQKWWLNRKGILFCQKNGQLWLIQENEGKVR
jgi:hypothetical protein